MSCKDIHSDTLYGNDRQDTRSVLYSEVYRYLHFHANEIKYLQLPMRAEQKHQLMTYKEYLLLPQGLCTR